MTIMHDRGDKIVTLARELLRCDASVEPEASLIRISLSFKMLCLTTIITAFGSSGITFWANEMQRPLNRYERTELEALIYYAVHEKGVRENELRQSMQSQLGVSDLNDMKERDFALARHYLQTIAVKNLPAS